MLHEPDWIDRQDVIDAHEKQIARYGGLPGIRDDNALESAMNRARQRYHYGGETDPITLAASYAFGLARNHPFNDGNKRAAFVICGLFLRENGLRLVTTFEDGVKTFQDLAAGMIDEDILTTWLRDHTRPLA